MKKVSFKSMENGTAEEYAFLNGLEDEFNLELPSRLIASLRGLNSSFSGYQISRI